MAIPAIIPTKNIITTKPDGPPAVRPSPRGDNSAGAVTSPVRQSGVA